MLLIKKLIIATPANNLSICGINIVLNKYGGGEFYSQLKHNHKYTVGRTNNISPKTTPVGYHLSEYKLSVKALLVIL